jgi:hypothetical protein
MALTDYNHIRTALFVKIEVDQYYDAAYGGYRNKDLLFSDHYKDFELFTGETYTALGDLVGVSSSMNELTPTSGTLTLTISGVASQSITEITRTKFNSSRVTVYRAFFTQNGELIDDVSITNPVGRYNGYVNNYTLQEDWDQELRFTSNTISLECSNSVTLLSKKTSGRKTNPTSMKKYYPNDVSFDRIPALVNAKIDFGGAS